MNDDFREVNQSARASGSLDLSSALGDDFLKKDFFATLITDSALHSASNLSSLPHLELADWTLPRPANDNYPQPANDNNPPPSRPAGGAALPVRIAA